MLQLSERETMLPALAVRKGETCAAIQKSKAKGEQYEIHGGG